MNKYLVTLLTLACLVFNLLSGVILPARAVSLFGGTRQAAIVSSRQISVTTAATGTNWTAFPAQDLKSLTITNTSGVTLLVRLVGGSDIDILAANATKVYDRITDASQLEVKRQDDSNTQVTTLAEAKAGVLYRPFPGKSNLIEALSLDRLFYEYTGPDIRVRRALDNTESDIGFNAYGRLDTTALKAFCQGPCFVKTVYDKSGNGRDVTQATTANQPRIINSSGVIENINGNPAMFFDGTNDSLGNNGSGFPTGSAAFTSIIRLKFFDRLVGTRTYLKWGAESLNTGIIQTRDTNSDQWVRTGNGQYVSQIESDDYAKTIMLVNNGTTFVGYRDGIRPTWINLPPTYNIAAGNFTIGNNAITFANPFYGHINEVIIYNKALTDAERLAYQSNIEARNSVNPIYNFVVDGDSIWYGYSGMGNRDAEGFLFSLRYRIMDRWRAKGISFRTMTVAVTGSSPDEWDTRAKAAGGIDTWILPPAKYNILFVSGNQNSIGNQSKSPAVSYTDYVSYVANRKATGKWDRIIVATTEPASSLVASDAQLQLADLIRQGMKPVSQGGTGTLLAAGATDLLDKQAIPDPGVPGYFPWADRTMYTNVRYKPYDQIHPGPFSHSLFFAGCQTQIPVLNLR